MKTWSKELIEKTRQELEDMLAYTCPSSGKLHWLVGNMDLEQGACFKNIDGKSFGIMSVENAFNQKYIIELRNNGGQKCFETVDALIDAGWVLD
jgi:hypothetical protein